MWLWRKSGVTPRFWPHGDRLLPTPYRSQTILKLGNGRVTCELDDVFEGFPQMLVFLQTEFIEGYITDLVLSTLYVWVKIELEVILSWKDTMFYYCILVNSILSSSTCSVERGLFLYILSAQLTNIIINPNCPLFNKPQTVNPHNHPSFISFIAAKTFPTLYYFQRG